MAATSKDDVARALVNRGAAKCGLGDQLGAISDFTTVVGMAEASKEGVARAIFNRGVCKRQVGDARGALADMQAAVDFGVMDDGLVANAATIAFGSLFWEGDREGAAEVLRKFSAILNQADEVDARQNMLGFLGGISSPSLKDAWPKAWRILSENAQPKLKEALDFLEPVCRILEGADRAILAALPPEQRDFAETVLARFEREPDQPERITTRP